MKIIKLSVILALTACSTPEAKAAITIVSASFVFSGLTIHTSEGSVEILSPEIPEFHLSSVSTLDVIPGVSSSNAAGEMYGGYIFRFIVHPDEHHSIGQPADFNISFHATGTTDLTGTPIAGLNGFAQTELTFHYDGAQPQGTPPDPSFVLDLNSWETSFLATDIGDPSHVYDNGDFSFTSGGLAVAYGYTYTLGISGRTSAVQLYNGEYYVPETVPESGASLCMIAIGLVGIIAVRGTRQVSQAA